MKDKDIARIRKAYEMEVAAESAVMHKPRRAAAVTNAAESLSPDTPVGTGSANQLSAAPAIGNEGAVDSKSIEVEAKQPRRGDTEAAHGDLLDAWFAVNTDPAMRALLRSGVAADVIRETVLGPDDRVEVTNTQAYPWRCICDLILTAANGTMWGGTGWLVGPRILLTAGHCVFMADQGGWCRQIEVIPGRRGGTRPYESCISTAYRSVNGWTQDADANYDYGAVLLPEDCRYGDRLGWFGFQVRNDNDLEDITVNISGYPCDKPQGTQWWHANQVTDVEDRQITYQVDTAGCQSGAPVWVFQDGNRYGVGVHAYGSLAGNSATRVTQGVFDNIRSWKAEVA